jgi:hypothetical protein
VVLQLLFAIQVVMVLFGRVVHTHAVEQLRVIHLVEIAHRRYNELIKQLVKLIINMVEEKYPETAATFYSAVLTKIVVLFVLKNGTRKLVTWNEKVLELFGVDYTQKKELYKLYNNSEFLVAYEPLFDRDIKIILDDIQYPIFIGIPFEIPPPLYLNPAFKDLLSDEQIHEVQLRFLNNIKKYRDLGHYNDTIDITADSDICDYLLSFKGFTLSVLNLTNDEHNSLEVFKEDFSHDFHFYTNKTLVEKLLKNAPKLALAPIIYECLKKDFNNFSKEVTEYLDDSNFISNNDLKKAWLQYLENTRLGRIAELQKDYNNKKESINNFFIEQEKMEALFEIKDLLSQDEQEILTQYKQNICDLMFKRYESFENQYVFEQDILSQCEKIVEVLSKKSIINKLTPPQLMQFFNNEFALHNDIIRQYEYAIDSIINLNFGDIMQYFNDSRIFLRYWPEEFGITAPFHDFVRPFTDTETKCLLSLLKDKGDVDLNLLYIAGPATSVSVITLLEKQYIDTVREKRLKQIAEIAEERVKEIRTEMDPVKDEFTEEEKSMFEDMIKEITNIDMYKQELCEENTLIGVLSYWPLALYPKPDNIADI